MGAYDNWIKLKKTLKERADKNSLDFSHQVLTMMDDIEKSDIRDMHNTIRLCYFDMFNKEPELDNTQKIANIIPEHLNRLADQWGWDDTEVRDNVHEWLDTHFNK